MSQPHTSCPAASPASSHIRRLDQLLALGSLAFKEALGTTQRAVVALRCGCPPLQFKGFSLTLGACCPLPTSPHTHRLEQLLALGSLVFKEESGYHAFFHHLISPHQHYLPVWKETPKDTLQVGNCGRVGVVRRWGEGDVWGGVERGREVCWGSVNRGRGAHCGCVDGTPKDAPQVGRGAGVCVGVVWNGGGRAAGGEAGRGLCWGGAEGERGARWGGAEVGRGGSCLDGPCAAGAEGRGGGRWGGVKVVQGGGDCVGRSCTAGAG